MGMSASQGRLLLLTARKNDLEFRAQQISQRRLILSQQLEEIAQDYEEATSNRQMKINLHLAGANESNVYTTRTANLTYAALVSGTVSNVSSSVSGIQPYGRTENQEYTSNTNYRLVTADGTIVVSDKSEIPTSFSSTVSSTIAASKGNGEVDKEKLATLYDALNATDNGEYMIASSDFQYGTIDGKEVIRVVNPNYSSLETDTEEKQDKYLYYDASSGAKLASVSGTFSPLNSDGSEKRTFSLKTSSDARVCQISTPTTTEYSLVEGKDNEFSLVDSNNAVIFRYVVDETLKYGTTDSNGTSGDGPNYLQDCLRNGKYLLEKCDVDLNDGNKQKWKSLSWDATANISDSYYTEDDDKAKAKYDRLQTQIQNQDKKLELELDNIETQRSAVTTEMESVQKVIDDNVQDSFKVFNA